MINSNMVFRKNLSQEISGRIFVYQKVRYRRNPRSRQIIHAVLKVTWVGIAVCAQDVRKGFKNFDYRFFAKCGTNL